MYYLVSRKKVPSIRIGRNVRIREMDLVAGIDSLITTNGAYGRH